MSHLNSKLIIQLWKQNEVFFRKPQFAYISVTFLFTSNTRFQDRQTQFYGTFAFSRVFLTNQARQLGKRETAKQSKSNRKEERAKHFGYPHGLIPWGLRFCVYALLLLLWQPLVVALRYLDFWQWMNQITLCSFAGCGMWRICQGTSGKCASASSYISTIPCKKSWDTVLIKKDFSVSDIFVFLYPSSPFQCCCGRKIYRTI